MLSLNVNGFGSHLHKITVLLRDMMVVTLALNETKRDGSIDQQYTDIAGYSEEGFNRCTAIHIRNNIKFIPRNYIPVENLELL